MTQSSLSLLNARGGFGIPVTSNLGWTAIIIGGDVAGGRRTVFMRLLQPRERNILAKLTHGDGNRHTFRPRLFNKFSQNLYITNLNAGPKRNRNLFDVGWSRSCLYLEIYFISLKIHPEQWFGTGSYPVICLWAKKWSVWIWIVCMWISGNHPNSYLLSFG